MNVITQRQLIQKVAQAWWDQYFHPRQLWTPDRKLIYDRLAALDLNTCSAEAVNEIIGNKSWTRLPCHECGSEVETVIQVGQEPDYESHTACLCAQCVTKAKKLIEEAA